MSKRKSVIFLVMIMAVIIVTILLTAGCGKQEKASESSQHKAVSSKTLESHAKKEWKHLTEDVPLSGGLMDTPGSWKLLDGVLTFGGKGYIWTKERYGDFVLDCEFKISPGGNSGIFFRTADLKDPVQTGVEMQIYDTPHSQQPLKNDCGALYDLLAPASYAEKAAGEWNHVIITCNDNFISVTLNGVNIIENMDIDRWDTPGKNPDGTGNKFKKALKDFSREGHIGLQDHGDPVWFRSVKIKEL